MNSSRRDFFKQMVGALGAVVAAPVVINALTSLKAKAADAVKYVLPGQGMAASINYLEDKKKAKKELQIDRQGVKFAEQKCDTCQLYTKSGDNKYGKCALFPTEMVKADAWCSSWSKKV